MKRITPKKLSIYVISFLLPVLLVSVVMFRQGILPFGDVTLLNADLDIQYIDFYGYLQNVLQGKDSLFYSFYKSLGGNVMSLFAYYLANPINLLVVFFSREQLPLFISLMTILKYGLIGVTSSIYFLKRFKGLGAYTIIFSLLYAMSEYVLLNMRNVMWMDAVIVLPLVFLGVYQLVNQHRTLLLYGSLFLAVVINWYSGYMVCLMAFCYFLFEYFSWANHRFKLRTFLPKISRFIIVR